MLALVSGYTQKSSGWPRDLRHSMKRIHAWRHDLYVIFVDSLASSQYFLQARSNLRRRQQATSGFRSWEVRAHLWYASNRDCCVNLHWNMSTQACFRVYASTWQQHGSTVRCATNSLDAIALRIPCRARIWALIDL
jgi:hypothetical protein